MDEQKTQTSAQPEHIPLLLIARELWRKLGLILMFAATVAACGYIAATLLYRPVYQTQTTFVVSVRNGSTVYANLNTASSMAETLSTFFEGDVMRKCITNDIGAASGTIKAKQIPETNLLTMTVSAPTQRDAHRITQSVLRNYNEQANKLLGDVALDVLCRPTVPVAPANSSGAVRIAKLSGLAGLLAAALYLAVRVYLRDTVKCEADVEQKLDTRLLATVRHEKKYKTLRAQLCLRKRKTSILITNPTTGFAFVETFKRLRTRVDYLMRRAQGRTILVTSLLEDEGKSTVAVNLALAMARRHKNVLLIDLDMKKPALYKLLDCQQEEFFPLETYLRGDAPVKKLVREDTRRGIYTILSRKGVGDTAQLLDSARLHDLLTQMHTRMDVIIIDTPPMSAGGSIGSELCRQAAAQRPKRLIIFDIYENNAYDIQMELRRTHPELDLVVLIGSVRDRERVMQVFDRYRPDLVCHAAAHKHVPLMETSPFEAIKNNVFGTYNVAQAADRFGTQRFILISTDKAVNPTNVMGASKRLCEMIVQMMNDRSATEYVAVRFGNVLGSAGSVIPLFRKQIRSGGPVTVTDKRVIRYFMTIPEAVQLIFQAGAYARGGEIFVLDMGEPVRIDDLARNMIRLSGFEPDVDIPVVYTGLRPGEKLYEELLLSGEGMQKTKNDLIYIGHEIAFDPAAFEENLMLLRAIPETDEPALRAKLRELVPTFHAPDGQTLPQNAAVG